MAAAARGERATLGISTNVSTKPPIDVGQGECAIGLAIDFYGRGRGQAISEIGADPRAGRVGCVDPAGSVYVDADPVSVLRAGPARSWRGTSSNTR